MTTYPSLDDRLRAAIGTKVPGVALVVVGPEGVRARSAAGVADLGAGTPMTTDHVMPWFSMTKIATATTAMRLVGQLLELDAPVAPLVPAMQTLRPADRAARITVRHLLQHSAGLSNPIPVRWIHPADQPGPHAEALLTGLLSKHAKLRFEPGARSSYSNLGTLILGSAIAHATGRSYDDAASDEVLQPLRMTSTAFTFAGVAAAAAATAATGYHPRRSPMRLFLPRWVVGPPTGRWISLRPFLLDGAAYGGLVGTPEDAARLLRMHLRDGELDGTRLISADAAARMRRIDKRGRRFDLGLGWFAPASQRDADPPYVEHLGGGVGFFNVMRLYPTVGVGAVVMGNATTYDVDSIARLALDYASPSGAT